MISNYGSDGTVAEKKSLIADLETSDFDATIRESVTAVSHEESDSAFSSKLGLVLLVFAFAFLLAASSNINDSFTLSKSSRHESSMRQLFLDFTEKHGKVYDSDEELSSRYEIFINNLALIAERNMAEKRVGGSATHGISQFADMTDEEFMQQYQGVRLPAISDMKNTVNVPQPVESTVLTSSATSSNWISTYTTSVREQGKCGSCWAVSSAEQIESDTLRVLKNKYNVTPDEVDIKLSVQQLVDCVYYNIKDGCSGGWPSIAFTYVELFGIELNVSYPYLAHNETVCKADESRVVLTLAGHTNVYGNEEWMKAHVLNTGPLVIAVHGTYLKTYTGGVIKNCGENGHVSHGVQVVGLNMEDSNNPYWIVRNSWGRNWGENGYFYLAYGENMCNCSYYAAYTYPKAYSIGKDSYYLAGDDDSKTNKANDDKEDEDDDDDNTDDEE
mmetsp:Transcript_313/g.286  ORF Transcript_313/g.286 Transcript_313/m.286 type:complete len:444 (+) Transcript_313:142-1473(+)